MLQHVACACLPAGEQLHRTAAASHTARQRSRMLTHESLHYAGATEQAGATLVHDAAAVRVLAPDPLKRPAVSAARVTHGFMPPRWYNSTPRWYNSTLETQHGGGGAHFMRMVSGMWHLSSPAKQQRLMRKISITYQCCVGGCTRLGRRPEL